MLTPNCTTRMNLMIDFCHHVHYNMWHIQGERVTSHQYSILISWYKPLVHLKCYILIKPHHNRTSGCRDKHKSLRFLNNEKHYNLQPHLAHNSISIFLTSDSSPWSCHICEILCDERVRARGLPAPQFEDQNTILGPIGNPPCNLVFISM